MNTLMTFGEWGRMSSIGLTPSNNTVFTGSELLSARVAFSATEATSLSPPNSHEPTALHTRELTHEDAS